MDVNNVQEQQYPVPPGAGNTQSNSSAGNRASASSTAYVPNHGAQAPQSSQTVRRIFHITPSTSSPSSPSNVRMVSVEEIFDETEVEIIQDVQRVQGEEEEWIILDSGSDVSLLPSRYATNTKRQRNHQLTDCQGGTLRTRGTRQTDLQVVDSEGEEILLRHEFIIGDVTTGLLSLGQLYQSGWKVDSSDGGQLFLEDPNKQVKIPVHFRNKSFAIKACVRHVEAGHELSDVDCVRAIVAAHNEVEVRDSTNVFGK